MQGKPKPCADPVILHSCKTSADSTATTSFAYPLKCAGNPPGNAEHQFGVSSRQAGAWRSLPHRIKSFSFLPWLRRANELGVFRKYCECEN